MVNYDAVVGQRQFKKLSAIIVEISVGFLQFYCFLVDGAQGAPGEEAQNVTELYCMSLANTEN